MNFSLTPLRHLVLLGGGHSHVEVLKRFGMQPMPGVALIALRGDYPVLPCAITGSQHMSLPFMFFKPFRRWHITLTVGEPFVLPKPERLNAEAAAAGTREIMARIAALLPESYRGYYGSSGEGAREPAPPLAGDT